MWVGGALGEGDEGGAAEGHRPAPVSSSTVGTLGGGGLGWTGYPVARRRPSWFCGL